MTPARIVDILVIGAGPAGQKAAVQGAKAGRSVLLVEREAAAGGECVQRGTIPSKTLRQSAVRAALVRAQAQAPEHSASAPERSAAPTTIASLMTQLDRVQRGHEGLIQAQLERNGIELARGRARFVSEHEVEIVRLDGALQRVRAAVILIASGSRPRQPRDIPLDHEHVLDSDSILSLSYLPASLVVLGSGVIACEFATIFQALGTRVTLVDKSERPLAFLDAELTARFQQRFERDGGRYVAGQTPQSVLHDGFSAVITQLSGGETLQSEKLLVALGRSASVAGMGLEHIGLVPNERGFLAVDAFGRTGVPHIYAAGDVIGPPALATTSMDQGRRAIRHALGLELGQPAETIPVGIYTIPEMASVGLSESEALRRHGHVLVGRARFDELARGQISGDVEGLLKLVTDARGEKLYGAQIIGEGATELIHLAQMALIGGMEIDAFVDNIFNFPTLAEAYRVAALDVASQRARLALAG